MRNIELRVVLVRSLYERNIGATSRAMANMGVKQLILVAPQCDLTIEAQKAAATGQEALQNRIVYKDWQDFYTHEPRGLQIATSARDGRGRQSEDLETTLTRIRDTHPEMQNNKENALVIHILFGPEDHGLEARDLEYANHCCSLPTFGENPSLNLAQASLLALYISRSVFGGNRTRLGGQQKPREKQKRAEIFPEKTLRTWLETMNMDISKGRINAFTVLRRMLLQNAPSEEEFRILEITLQQSIRRMKESKKTNSD